MNSVDLIVLVLILLNGAIGAYRGFTWQVFRLGSLALGWWLGSRFAVEVADGPLGGLDWDETGRRVVAWVVIFVGTYLIMSWLGGRFRSLIEKARLTSSDRSLGFLLGGLKGLVFVAIAFQILVIFAPVVPSEVKTRIWGDGDHRPSQAAKLHQKLLVNFMNDLIPDEMGDKVIDGVRATNDR
ncbi:MAG: hypothetical protein CL908_19945 [Deltaproteobacteria bacterium]|nr:hypothetical protein [Deltaproteobacteria bacterium]